MPDEKDQLLSSLSAQMSSLQTILDRLTVEGGASDTGGTEYLDAVPEWIPERIYKIKNGMPITQENANAAAIGLLACVKWLGEKLLKVEGSIPGTERFDELYKQLSELDVANIREDLEYYRRVTDLNNRYAKDKFWNEIFSSRNTLSDLRTITVIQAVGGSECVDVLDTSVLDLGCDYVIKSAQGQEEIRVAEILSNTRFKAEGDLKRSYSNAKLYRTTFDFAAFDEAGGLAYAQPGDVYYSKKITLNATGVLQNIYIGRDDRGGVLDVYYRDDSVSDWTKLENKSSVRRDDGVTEDIYTLPQIEGGLELKVVCSGHAVEVYYITIHLSYTDVDGQAFSNVEWGNIIGDIANQKDLQNALKNAGSVATTTKAGLIKLAEIPTDD